MSQNLQETRFTKVIFRRYMDISFTTPEVRGEIDEHLGILGPVIKAEVGQSIMVRIWESVVNRKGGFCFLFAVAYSSKRYRRNYFFNKPGPIVCVKLQILLCSCVRVKPLKDVLFSWLDSRPKVETMVLTFSATAGCVFFFSLQRLRQRQPQSWTALVKGYVLLFFYIIRSKILLHT